MSTTSFALSAPHRLYDRVILFHVTVAVYVHFNQKGADFYGSVNGTPAHIQAFKVAGEHQKVALCRMSVAHLEKNNNISGLYHHAGETRGYVAKSLQ